MGASSQHIHLNYSSDSESSPTSVLPTAPKLQTILSANKEDAEITQTEEHKIHRHSDCKRNTLCRQRKIHWRNSSRPRSTKSLTELEDEELKGFMDLGFVFSEDDQKDPNLVSILPGLQRLARNSRGRDESRLLNDDGFLIRTPYLSKAWDVMEKKEAIWKRTLLVNLKIGETDNNDMLVKQQIKLWARSVASAVR